MSALQAQRFAVVGCGAIAESFFLPVLAKRPDLCSSLWLVDGNPERLQAMAKLFGITTTAPRLDQRVLDNIDAAVIATPHDTHYPISQTFISAGKHVLCEKPMTVTFEDGADMVALADRAGVVLMTNNWRRQCPAFREIKRIIEAGELGRPIAATWTEGKKYNWPTSSGFYFTQQSRNNLPPPGILLDIGAHVIDLLCWWFGDNPSVVDCRTDSFGGPEARVTLVVDFAGVKVQTDLSYYQKMTNGYRLEFEGGHIEGNAWDPHRFMLHRRDQKTRTVTRSRIADPAAHMIANFVGAIGGRNAPSVTGRDVLPSIKVIADAYRGAQSYDAPWLPRF